MSCKNFALEFGKQHQLDAERRESEQGHETVHVISHILCKCYLTCEYFTYWCLPVFLTLGCCGMKYIVIY